jgi:uncharacterized repeat protein (TIGR03803 family)
MLNANDMLYGTTSLGGGGSCSRSRGCGAVFSLSLTGKYATLYGFPNSLAGEYPNTGLTDAGGTLYGTTWEGGSAGDGTVFSLSTSGQENTLYSFTGESDGASPAGDLIYVNGNLYGTAAGGGRCSWCGTVYEITTSGSVTVLHDFPSKLGDGDNPSSGLTAVHGKMYGTTYGGALGTIYSITTSGTEKVLYAFLGGAGGQFPHGLTNVNGTLFGTAGGGSKNDGIAYSATTTGKTKILYSFAGGTDGSNPVGDLVDNNGILYGVTSSGGGTGCGGSGCGTIFSLTTSGTEKVLYSFSGGSAGADPDSTLVLAKGALYGTTLYGGDGGKLDCKSGCGVAFSLSL